MTSLLESRQPRRGIELPKLHAPDLRGSTLVLVALDATLIVVSTIIAIALREALPFAKEIDVVDSVLPIALFVPLVWLLLLFVSGAYDRKWQSLGMTEYNRVAAGSLALLTILGVGAYLADFDMSRGFYVLLAVVTVPGLLLGRLIMRRVTNSARAAGRWVTPTLLAGRSGHVSDLLTILQRERWLGYQVAGLLLPPDEQDPTNGRIPVLGTPDAVVDVIKNSGAKAVIFADGAFERANQFSLLARELEDLDAQTIFVPTVADISANRLQTRPMAGIPLVFVERPQAARAGSWMKRVFDVVGSLASLVVFGPVLLVAAILIKASDGGPVMFKQERVGIGNRPFTCYKLRSMVVNAEQLTAELAAQSDGNGVLFKMAKDPRITPIGRFIRRYSIDELPQLFNVLKGDMSMIGPRPALPKEVDLYEQHVLRRLAVRPGMTGLWQVSGRSDLSWDDTVRLDLYYVDNWSMMQDINILMRTIGAVLRPNGAY